MGSCSLPPPKIKKAVKKNVFEDLNGAREDGLTLGEEEDCKTASPLTKSRIRHCVLVTIFTVIHITRSTPLTEPYSQANPYCIES